MNKKECACGCGQEIPFFDKKGRERFYILGHINKNKKFSKEQILKRKLLINKKKRVVGVCQCGCNKEIKEKYHYKFSGIPKYLKGHGFRGKRLTEEHKKSISKAQTGRKRSKEQKMKHSNYMKNLFKEGKLRTRRGQINKNKYENICCPCGKKFDTYKLRGKKYCSSLCKHKFQFIWNRNLTKETNHLLKDLGEKCKIRWQNPEYKEKAIKSILKGLMKRPTSYEKKIINIINKYNFPYKYTGDGSFLIGYKNPDFINCNGEKTCIEVYFSFFKEKNYNSNLEYEKQRSEHFAKYGWKTIFINESEINNENLILNKIIYGGIL